jgi:murein DD-endopeptidase MepM/ murein hydrolase activator NlpD
MTSSGGRNQFQITPKRSQFENLAVTPEKPTLPGAPAQPNRERYRTGGQLYDKSSFQTDERLQSAVDAIEEFIDPQTGGWTKSQEMLLQHWRTESQKIANSVRQADSWLESVDAATKNAERNADVVRLLEKKGEIELARETALNDNTNAFYYWDAVAYDAGRDAAITLRDIGIKDLTHIASLDETKRGLYIQELAAGALKGYEHIPSAARAARIDPLMASVSAELKAEANSRAREFKDDVDRRTSTQKLRGAVSEASKLIFADQDGPLVVANIRTGILKQRAFWMNDRGKSGRFATEQLSLSIQNGDLFVDTNQDSWDDWAQAGVGIDASYFLKSLDGMKVIDEKGEMINLLDARDSAGISIRDRIREYGKKQSALYTAHINAQEKSLNAITKDFQRDIISDSNDWGAQNPNASYTQIEEQRNKVRNQIEKEMESNGALKDLFGDGDIEKLLDRAYPLALVDTPPDMEADILAAVNRSIWLDNDTEIPPDIMQMMTTEDGKYYSVYKDVRKLYGDSNKEVFKNNRTKVNNLVKENITSLKGELPVILRDHPGLIDLYKGSNEGKAHAKELVDVAQAKIFPILEPRFKELLRNNYVAAIKAKKDINSQVVQKEIYNSALNDLKSDPLLGDIDSWIQKVPGTNQYRLRNIATPDGVVLSYPNGEFVPGQINSPSGNGNKANFTYSDNGLSASLYYQGEFVGPNARKNFDEFTRKTILIPEDHLKAWSHARTLLSQGKPIPEGLITEDMRETLTNLSSRATNGAVEPWELLKRSHEVFYGNTKTMGLDLSDEDNKSIYQQLGSLTGSVSASNEADDSIDSSSITVKPMTRLIYGVNNYGVSVSLTKGNDQQFSNDVPTPVNGEIVEVGNNSIDGNFVVIRTNSKSNYNEKGDLVKISNLASTDVEVGDVVEPGEQIGLQGDDTDLNSGERSTTGSIVSPGHLTVQIFQGDTGEVGTDTQYSQGYNTAFVNGMFIPLYTDVLAAANEVPATPINIEKGLGWAPDDIDVGGAKTIILPETTRASGPFKNADGTWRLEGPPFTRSKLHQIASDHAMGTLESQLSLRGGEKLKGGFLWTSINPKYRKLYFQLRDKNLKELIELENTRVKPTEAELEAARTDKRLKTVKSSNFATNLK